MVWPLHVRVVCVLVVSVKQEEMFIQAPFI